MGAIGHLMSGTGIEDVLSCIYAETAVTHMMSGKAISRAVRGHLIINAVLNALLISMTYDIPLVTPKSLLEEELDGDVPNLEKKDYLFPEKNVALDNLAKTFDQVTAGYIDTTQLNSSESFTSVINALTDTKRNKRMYIYTYV